MRIGVDLGGTNIRAALIDGQTIIRKAKSPCPAKGTCEEVLETVAGLISEVLCEGVEAIGIGSAASTCAVIISEVPGLSQK